MIKSNISWLDKYSERIAVLTLENGSKNLLSEPEFIHQNVLMNWLAENPEVQALIVTGSAGIFSMVQTFLNLRTAILKKFPKSSIKQKPC